MGKKIVPVIAVGAEIETVVEVLTSLGYVYLDGSDFKRGYAVYDTMSKKPYKCYHLRSNRINLRTVEEIDIWKPQGKVFCELVFTSDGLSERSSTTIGKNQFNGTKALALAEKNIVTNET